MIRRFARPYARAILEVAKTPDEAKKIQLELVRFDEARRLTGELSEVFGNPAVEIDVKAKIASAIASRLGLTDLSKRIIEVLVRNHRINQIGEVAAALRAMVNESMKISIVRVRTAHELSESETTRLREALEARFGRKLELELATDPSLLAGFIAQIESEVYDTSVAGRINRFRESLTH